jgi:AcrR family transcriptional regulator
LPPIDTKLLIADAFVELCDERPLKKVSISDVIARTGKNRKTFYYHFVDKDSLIIWRFRYDLGQELKRKFPESVLIYEKEGEESLLPFPYYITQKSGVRSLDHSKFFDAFATVLERRRTFYAQALLETGPHSLREYLYNLYLPAIRRDILIILANRYLPEENIDFLSEFYTCAFVYYFIRKCDQPGAKHLIANAGPFSNIIHSSLENQIKEAQLLRNL